MKEQNEKTADTAGEKSALLKKPWVKSLSGIVIIFAALGGFLYWQSVRGTVFIENSFVEAPIITIAPSSPGVLNALYVKEGERIAPNTQVALVGSQILTAAEGGIVSSAPKVTGSYFSPGQAVVQIVNDSEMKIVGAVDETKGLSEITIGQPATFSVDAFPGKSYIGVVDAIAATSDQSGVAFDISDKRPTEKFDVKVRFDIAKYPELRNGMSAKITVHMK